MTAPATRPCRACGRELVFATGPGGKLIPLNVVRNVYVLDANGDALVVLAGSETFQSHFESCPSASTFSKKTKTQEDPIT